VTTVQPSNSGQYWTSPAMRRHPGCLQYRHRGAYLPSIFQLPSSCLQNLATELPESFSVSL
jgi:hypothetical protein